MFATVTKAYNVNAFERGVLTDRDQKTRTKRSRIAFIAKRRTRRATREALRAYVRQDV